MKYACDLSLLTSKWVQGSKNLGLHQKDQITPLLKHKLQFAQQMLQTCLFPHFFWGYIARPLVQYRHVTLTATNRCPPSRSRYGKRTPSMVAQPNVPVAAMAGEAARGKLQTRTRGGVDTRLTDTGVKPNGPTHTGVWTFLVPPEMAKYLR